jgi:sugar phosphate isomerase/epimerase
MSTTTRKKFITQLAGMAAIGIGATACAMNRKATSSNKTAPTFFEISLAEWSLHKALFSKKMSNLDFPVIAKQQFGISTVEYVNQFFKDKATDSSYLNELLKRCNDNGVKNHLIMCDGEGDLGDPDNAKRTHAVENHYKWVDAAKFLGCATIRVNAAGQGSTEDVQTAAVDGLSRLAEYAAKENINVIVENHGGYSSNGAWLAGVMKNINRSNVGTLPDFGNFCIKSEGGKCIEEYDRYKGVTELMPFAKGSSAKAYDFDNNGNCVETDYYKMMKIVKDSGFHGYMGIEYEGDKLREEEGIRKTKALLEKTAAALS